MSDASSRWEVRGPRAWLRQHRAIAREFIAIGLIRKSQFRVEFLMQVLMDTCWYAVHIATIEILFLHTESIAGWGPTELRVLVGFLFVSDAFMAVWLGQAWHFGRELKDGGLDTLRVRPASPVFLYFFQRFSLEGLTNMAMALGYLGYAVVTAGIPLGMGSVVLLVWAVLMSFWARTVVMVLVSTWEFFVLNSDIGSFFNEIINSPTDRPLDIFGRRTRTFLIYLLPIGMLSHVPAAMVLGRVSWGWSLLYTLWLLLMGWGVFGFWKRSFRHYESALG